MSARRYEEYFTESQESGKSLQPGCFVVWLFLGRLLT